MRAPTLEQRLAALIASDTECAGAIPDRSVAERISNPGLSLSDVVAEVMQSYAERPALGSRAIKIGAHPVSGRRVDEVTGRLDTVTYSEVWERSKQIARGLQYSRDGRQQLQHGDRVAVLGFSCIDYAVLDLALTQLDVVAVPIQHGAPTSSLEHILAEVQPKILAVSIECLLEVVEITLTTRHPVCLVVFDYNLDIDWQRDRFELAAEKLAAMGAAVSMETLADVTARGSHMVDYHPARAICSDEQLRLLLYTSGSTGAAKGAMYPERLVKGMWSAQYGPSDQTPWITMAFMPMNHVSGRTSLYGTLCRGGTSYFATRSDMSTFLEDLALIRPTQLLFVPRVWELIHQQYRLYLRRTTQAHALDLVRNDVIGGRALGCITGSAPMASETRDFVELLMGQRILDRYGSTEAGTVAVDGHIVRPPVIDYRLADIPELGYFNTDRPHPRGELLVKSEDLFTGYFKRPGTTADAFDEDGYYRTGDVVALVGPDTLRYLDRRQDVLKLSHGEFVAVSRLEALYCACEPIQQIYLYGSSEQSYVLAVVVPNSEVAVSAQHNPEAMKSMILEAFRVAADDHSLLPYEVPRDCIVEQDPFTVQNGLLTGTAKLAHHALKHRYRPQLEQLYLERSRMQTAESRSIRAGAADRPILDTVIRTAASMTDRPANSVSSEHRLADLGGDSLSATAFSNALSETFELPVPVEMIVSPASTLATIAEHICCRLTHSSDRPSSESVHRVSDTCVHASDLTLDKFFDTQALANTSIARNDPPRVVLLTGATGYLGRFLASEWMQRLAATDGQLICLVRGSDDAAASARFKGTLNGTDLPIAQHYNEFNENHLQVIAGDKSSRDLGLERHSWESLADKVDLIVDAGALVNHILPYGDLFAPNVSGTAELIRLALTGKLKQYCYVSTMAIRDQIRPSALKEDDDIRIVSATRRIDDSYANGYLTSKWASEVLLRQAHDQFGLPSTIFRCSSILVDSTRPGHLNTQDALTRLIFSILATGIAPGTFYDDKTEDAAPPRHVYDGLPVDFLASVLTELSTSAGFSVFHATCSDPAGPDLDQFVDWLILDGHRIQRLTSYDDWFHRFDIAMRALPEAKRRQSLLPLLHSFRFPLRSASTAIASNTHFRDALRATRPPCAQVIPSITHQTVSKYASSVERFRMPRT